jgi:hypothetical protein
MTRFFVGICKLRVPPLSIKFLTVLLSVFRSILSSISIASMTLTMTGARPLEMLTSFTIRADVFNGSGLAATCAEVKRKYGIVCRVGCQDEFRGKQEENGSISQHSDTWKGIINAQTAEYQR